MSADSGSRRADVELSARLVSYAAKEPPGWDRLLDRARLCEAAGFDRVVLSDHVVFGERMDEYARPEVGGVRGGRQPTGPDGHWLEPLTTLSVLAGATSRIRLATGILLAALRRPVVLAKAAATLDVLSNGRLDLGVGVGWQREEYEAAGLDFTNRGRLLDHTLEVCTELWTTSPTRYESDELAFDRIHMMPKPKQVGGVPIWVSGTVNPRVVRRLNRFGHGWIPWGEDAADLASGVHRMRRALSDSGADPSNLRVQAMLPTATDAEGQLDIPDTIARAVPMVNAGASDLLVHLRLPKSNDAALEVASELVTAFRAATR